MEKGYFNGLVSRQRASREAQGQVDEEMEPRGEEQALRPETQGLRVLKPGLRAGGEASGRVCWRLTRAVLWVCAGQCDDSIAVIASCPHAILLGLCPDHPLV